MHRVLPLRTAPSQIMPLLPLWGDPGHHQVSACICLGEKGLNAVTIPGAPFLPNALGAGLQCLVKGSRRVALCRLQGLQLL